MPLVAVTSYEMTERLSCPAAKGRAAAPPGLCAGARPPCSNPHFCLACMRWRVVIVDGEGGRVSARQVNLVLRGAAC
jgi:hypothetical protein